MDVRTKKLLSKKCIRCCRVVDGKQVDETAISFIDFISRRPPDDVFFPYDEGLIIHLDKCMKTQPQQIRRVWRKLKKHMQAEVDSLKIQAPVDLSAAYDTFTAGDDF